MKYYLTNEHCFEDIFQRIHRSISHIIDLRNLDNLNELKPAQVILNNTAPKVKNAERLFGDLLGTSNEKEVLESNKVEIERINNHSIRITLVMVQDLIEKLIYLENHFTDLNNINNMQAIKKIMDDVSDDLTIALDIWNNVKVKYEDNGFKIK